MIKNKNHIRSSVFLVLLLFSAGLFSGCGAGGKDTGAVKLDPNNPVSLTIWHYYNGAQQAAFDELVAEYNATEGKEKGIYVESYSQGSVSDLEAAISDAVAGKVGADPLPEIFSTYTDTAYAVWQDGKLVDLAPYFTEEELSVYVSDYLREGYLSDNDELNIFPVAKSTEMMMLNTTDWEPFAKECGYSYDDLQTLEGVVNVAQAYYEWTDAQTPNKPDDGKAFYGRDSMSNYFIIHMKQMGVEIFAAKDGKVTINADKELIRRLWDNYYVPYVKGYFVGLGKFRSDDVKTGDLLAYTGSSASAMYFPDTVITDDETKDIGYVVLPAPLMEGGEDISVQQGAGMAVTKSDETKQYAACEFLKWFTRKENNLRFVCGSSYLPVTKEANTIEALDEAIEQGSIEVSGKIYDCLTSIIANMDTTTFYSTKCFENGFATRKILDYNLSDQAAEDKAAIDAAVEGGAERAEVTAAYITDEAFESWYASFVRALNEAAFPKQS